MMNNKSDALNQIAIESAKYVPEEHLPELTVSDWKQDYLSWIATVLGLIVW